MNLPRLRNDQLSGLMLAAIGVFVGLENRTYPLGSLQDPGPGYVPLLVAIALGVIGLLIALQGLRSKPVAEMQWPEAKRALVIMAACAGATLALEPLGYRLTVLALLIFFIGVVERKRPLMALTVAASFSFLSFYLVGDVLRVPLPRGPWGF